MQIAFSIPSSHVADKNERVRARRAERKQAWAAEIAALRSAKEKRDADAAEAKRPILQDERLISFLYSEGFMAWFEEITGESAKEFVDRACSVEPGMLALMRTTLDQMVRQRIFKALNKHRWDNPGYRRYWANEIANCEDAAKRRRIILRLATPKWADPIKMAAIYCERARIQAKTGVPHDVDHIVPLQGALVCGLNWEGNMRVVQSSINRMKSNHFLVA